MKTQEQSLISKEEVPKTKNGLLDKYEKEPVKEVTKETTKLPMPTGWRMLVLPFRMNEKTKGGVLSFILKGNTNILQPVGIGSLVVSVVTSVFSDFFNPTNSLVGVIIFFVTDVDDCSSVFILLLILLQVRDFLLH